MKKWILLALLGLSSAGASALSTSYVSAYTCGEYVAAQAGQKNHFNGIVIGYVSALNQVRQRLMPATKPQDLVLWVDQYCRQNPLENLADALTYLDKALEMQKR